MNYVIDLFYWVKTKYETKEQFLERHKSMRTMKEQIGKTEKQMDEFKENLEKIEEEYREKMILKQGLRFQQSEILDNAYRHECITEEEEKQREHTIKHIKGPVENAISSLEHKLFKYSIDLDNVQNKLEEFEKKKSQMERNLQYCEYLNSFDHGKNFTIDELEVEEDEVHDYIEEIEQNKNEETIIIEEIEPLKENEEKKQFLHEFPGEDNIEEEL